MQLYRTRKHRHYQTGTGLGLQCTKPEHLQETRKTAMLVVYFFLSMQEFICNETHLPVAQQYMFVYLKCPVQFNFHTMFM